MSLDETYLRDLINNDELRDSVDRIKRAVSDIWGGPRTDLPYVVANFTDHGPQHLTRVAGRIRQILDTYENSPLDDDEMYVLLCGLYLHDIGMQCDLKTHPEVVQRVEELGRSVGLEPGDLIEGVNAAQEQGVLVRKYHNLLSAAWVSTSRETATGSLFTAALSIPNVLVKDVMDVCMYHAKLDIMKCPERFENYPKLRKRFTAAILRFADELDIDYSRVSRPELVEEFNMPPENAAFWHLHDHTSVAFENNIVVIKISLNPQDEEAYGRAIEERHIRGPIEKNRDCLEVLRANGIPLSVDESSSRVVGIYGARSIPERYLKILAGGSEASTGAEPSQPEPGGPTESEANLIDLLSVGLRKCETVDDFVALLALVARLEPSLPFYGSEVNSIRSQALTALQDLTAENPGRAGLIIIRDVLPTCLGTSSSNTADAAHTTSVYREWLANWLYSYPIPVIADTRRGVVNALVLCLHTALAKEASWTLAGVGLREDTVSQALWEAASSDDPDVRDTALLALARLGSGNVERERLLAAIEPALHREDFSIPLWGALKSFRDPSLVQMLRDTWLAPDSGSEGSRKPESGLRLLADIADAYQEDKQLQRETWEIVQGYAKDHFKTVVGPLYMSINFGPHFDTREVILYLISLASAEEAHDYRLDLVCRRLIECIRPEQVATWSGLSEAHKSSLYPLLAATCRDTEAAVTSQTSEGMLKELAWEVLLRARIPNLITRDYLADCIMTESSWTLRGEALDWLSCFQIDPVPEIVVNLVTEEFNERGPALHEYAVRQGVVRLLRSAASKEAFDALLAFGYTIEGQVVGFSVNALSDVALHLASTDRQWVQQRLLETALTSTVLRHRQAALGALEELARADQFDADGIASLRQLLDEDSLPLTDRARVVNIIGLLGESVVPEDVFDQVVMLARSDSPDLNTPATLALARWGKMTAYPDLMKSRLGLMGSRGVWEWIEGFVPDSATLAVLGVLYKSNPSEFAPAVAGTLRTQGPRTLRGALQVMQWAHRTSSENSAPSVLWEAVAWLVTAGDIIFVPLADCIYAMSELDRTRFAQFDWISLCNEWDANVRQVLADELGKEVYATAAVGRMALDRLLDLTRDGDYQVRRSAFRGLSRLEYSRFRDLCLAWAASPEVALRQRAAEACVWLDPGAGPLPALTQLAADVELEVRQTAERARDERRRNAWASRYFHEVVGTGDQSNQSILDRWAYASALGTVGNDDSIRNLRTFMRSRPWAPHVKHWLRRVLGEMERQWEETKKSYPRPWPYWTGAIT